MSRRPSATNGRAQTQRIASGARANPYARPEPRRSAGPSTAAAATTQLSIRGASGPTWVVVSNLLRGTTEADIQETFRQFGHIEAVRLFTAKDNSLSFELAFTHASSAQGAIDNLHGVLADGRTLNVRKRESDAIPTAPRQQRPQQAIPTAPRNMQRAAVTPKNGSTSAAANDLQSRILSAAELRALSRKQAKAKQAKAGPNQASASSLALAKRIGSLPLAMRLGDSGKQTKGPAAAAGASATAASAAGKKRKRAKAAAAAKTKAKPSGMEVDS